MANLLTELQSRGLVHDATPGLAERLTTGSITGYVGFDPTASSLHVGNLVPVMGLSWLQRCGGTPIVLIGAGTGMVGDPSGKRAERPVLSVAQIDANADGKRQDRGCRKHGGPPEESRREPQVVERKKHGSAPATQPPNYLSAHLPRRRQFQPRKVLREDVAG